MSGMYHHLVFRIFISKLMSNKCFKNARSKQIKLKINDLSCFKQQDNRQKTNNQNSVNTSLNQCPLRAYTCLFQK